MTLYVGIDPGLDGGIVTLDGDGRVMTYGAMALLPGKPRRIDWDACAMLLERVRVGGFVTVEQQPHMPLKFGGGKANHARGGWVAWEFGCKLLKIPHACPRPQQWQRDMLIPGKGDTKQRALVTAQRLWPGRDWRASERCRKPHEGIVDAALIAEWGRRRA